jgi:FMN-dependent oxidoreductase (nitrilotriacetate monooxygenase family)
MGDMGMMHLGWFMGPGVTIQGWNDPGFPADYDWTKPKLFADMARELERACFDVVILEDSSTVPDNYGGSLDFYLKHAAMTPKFDPVPLVPYIAAATSHIGIAPTLTSTFYPPFLLARCLSTLDHFTSGRIGWNIVTATNDRAAQNYGLDKQIEHDLRYDMADEYIDLVGKLWDSWDADALVMDRTTGVFADPSKVHTLDFVGRHYKSRGPLNVPRSPQGRPVYVAPGASPRGRKFSGRNAELVLAGHADDVHAMKQYRDEVRGHAAAFGRDPDKVKVMFTFVPVVVASASDVAPRKQAMAAMREKNFEKALAAYSYLSGMDFSKLDLDTPLPEIKTNGMQSLLRTFQAAGPTATLREIATGIHTMTVVGTADAVAGQMQEAMEEIGGDGFLITGFMRPANILPVVNELVPALQRRGVMRTEYGYETFRDNLMAF